MEKTEGGYLNANSAKSSNRLMAIMAVVGGLLIGALAVGVSIYKGAGDIGTNMVALVLGLVGLGITGKNVGTVLERRK